MPSNDVMQLEKQLRLAHIERLVSRGDIVPVKSFDEYSATLQETKAKAEHRLFTNSYMMRSEVERLIRLNDLYRMDISSGIAFLEDQKSYWRMHLHVDLQKKLRVQKLDKSILIEFVYVEGKVSRQQQLFESILKKEDTFHFYETYRQIDSIPKLSREEFYRQLEVIKKLLKQEGMHICVPNDEQLEQIEELYRERIEMYTQTYYTFEERIKQRDEGLIICLVNSSGAVIALSFHSSIGGGAIAVRSEYSSNIYALSLMFGGFLSYYENMSSDTLDTDKPYKYHGWIAKRNIASNRVHEMFGISYTGKAFDQFIVPGLV